MNENPWILVVDDDAGTRHLLCDILTSAGFKYTGVALGTTALAMLLSGRLQPRAIVLDLHLPDMSGLQLIRSLQGNGIRIPTLVISGLLEILSTEQLVRIGCQAYLEKPFSSRLFLETLAPLAGAEPEDGKVPESIFHHHLEVLP